MPLTILSNNGSVSVVSNPETKSSISKYVEISFLDPGTCPNRIIKTVKLFLNTVCCIRYYDIEKQQLVTTRGKVIAISENYLVLRTTTMDNPVDRNPSDCCAPYMEMVTENITIPYNNMTDIQYTDMPIPVDEVVSTMIVGITAETIKAIVVRLGIMHDCPTKPQITYVDMKVGSTYHVTYSGMGKCDRCTIYELEGKLIKIEEVPDLNCNAKPCEGHVKPASCVSMNNNVYDSSCAVGFNKTKEEVMKDVIFTFDTSLTMDATYDQVHLVQIRDCEIVQEGEDVPLPPVDPEDPACCCCACTTPKNTTINFDDGSEANYKIQCGNLSTINVTTAEDGNNTDVELAELIKFYFGIS